MAGSSLPAAVPDVCHVTSPVESRAGRSSLTVSADVTLTAGGAFASPPSRFTPTVGGHCSRYLFAFCSRHKEIFVLTRGRYKRLAAAFDFLLFPRRPGISEIATSPPLLAAAQFTATSPPLPAAAQFTATSPPLPAASASEGIDRGVEVFLDFQTLYFPI